MTFDKDNNGTSQSPPSDMVRMNIDEMSNPMILSFDMRNPIDLSIDPTRQSNAMQDPQLSPTNARLTKINRDGTNNVGDYSQFVDDPNMIDLFINPTNGNDDSMDQQGLFQEIDMGELDEEERQYLLIDKDTGKVYDLRNENHLHKITAKSTRITQDLNSTTSSNVNNQSTTKG